jgi:hypothetical protein
MENKPVPLLKIIREKCLDCCCGSPVEVKLCPVKNCPLFPYRMGKNPFRKKRVLSEEQKELVAVRLKAARDKKRLDK